MAMLARRKRNPRRTTISPTGMKEYSTYYRMGEKYTRVLSIYKYPFEFVEGLLVRFVGDPNFDIDMVVEHSDLDIASALKNQMNSYEELYRKYSDTQSKERLRVRYDNLKAFISRKVRK